MCSRAEFLDIVILLNMAFLLSEPLRKVARVLRASAVLAFLCLIVGFVLRRNDGGLWNDLWGFCTFKMPASQSAEQLFQLPLVFARTRAVSLGTVQGVLPEQAAAVAELIATVSGFKQLHVWSRDSDLPG